MKLDMQRIREVFDEALRTPPPGRHAFLDRECGIDTALRRKVEGMLAAHETDSSFLEGLAWDEGEQLGGDEGWLPGRIGPYEVLGKLGSGGMGIVFEARQLEPARQVAIKVMRASTFDGAARERFKRETEVLAKLRHPAVATVYHAGTFEEAGNSMPFFAMELIEEARTITQHVKERSLDRRQTLELFIKACEGVAHGHSRGVLHRDLKPSNVLVDSEGFVKVIDFGVARTFDGDDTTSTGTGQLLGTLAYMSPEQARADFSDVDVRSDVYAMGVILHELVCGKGPYDVSSTPLPEALRIICEKEPEPPSRWDRSLRGDLDAILSKALAKEPDRRYQSISAVCEDLRRHLEGEAIQARRPTALYQLQVFGRRNKVLAFVISTSLAALLAAFVFSASQARIARQAHTVSESRRQSEARAKAQERLARIEAEGQREQAEATLRFLQSILAEADPTRTQQPDRKMSEVLSDASQRLRQATELAPLVRAALNRTIGMAYLSLGHPDRAIEHLENALAIRERLLSPDHESLAASVNDLALAYHTQGERELALALYERTRALYEARGESGRRDVAKILVSLGALHRDREDLEEAEEHLRQALAIEESLGSIDLDALATVLSRLGEIRSRRGDGQDALALHEEALAIRRKIYPESHHMVAEALAGVALSHAALGKLALAVDEMSRALEISREALGENPYVATQLHHLALVLSQRGHLKQAEAAYRQALELTRNLYGSEHPEYGTSLNNLAQLLYRQGKLQQAEPLLRRAVVVYRRIDDGRDIKLAGFLSGLAWLRHRQGDHDEAIDLFGEAIALRREHPSSLASDLARDLHNLGWVLRAKNDFDAAEPPLREAYSLRREYLGTDDVDTAITAMTLGRNLDARGKHEEAESWLRVAYESLERALGENDRRTRQVARWLVELHERRGDEEAAARWRKKLGG